MLMLGLIHPEMQRKKFHFCGGVGTLYCTVPYCTKLYSTLSKFGLQIFFLPFLDELGHIHLFLCVFGRLEKTQNFGNFPNFRGGGVPESLENSKLFLVFFWRLPLVNKVYRQETKKLQSVQFLATFSRSLLHGLPFHNYWWPMTHFLPRHGRFLYLTETLRLSQYYGHQGHSEWEVKIGFIGNISLF